MRAANSAPAPWPKASVEVIDLRFIIPFDEEAILNSVAKTNRVIILPPKDGEGSHDVDCHAKTRGSSWLRAHSLRQAPSPSSTAGAATAGSG